MTYNEESGHILTNASQYVLCALVDGKMVIRYETEDGLSALGLANKLNFEINAECKKEIEQDLNDFFAV